MIEIGIAVIAIIAGLPLWIFEIDEKYYDLLSPLVIAIAAGFTVVQFRSSIQLNHRQFAHELIRTWNENVTDRRGDILKKFEWNFIHHQKLGQDRCKEIFWPNNKELLDELTRILNYHENFATAYRRDIGDRAMIKRSVADNIKLWHTVFEDFIRLETCRRGYTDLMEIWRIEEEKELDGNLFPSEFGYLESSKSRGIWRRAVREFKRSNKNDRDIYAPTNCVRLGPSGNLCKKPCFLNTPHLAFSASSTPQSRANPNS